MVLSHWYYYRCHIAFSSFFFFFTSFIVEGCKRREERIRAQGICVQKYLGN